MSTDTETEVRERPIIFGTPMVKALIEGRKSQTRQVMQPQLTIRPYGGPLGVKWKSHAVTGIKKIGELSRYCPYGIVGERLWVREALDWPLDDNDDVAWVYAAGGDEVKADPYNDSAVDWLAARPFKQRHISSIRMPRWASRITLEITDVRVQRVQDITEADAEAEGFTLADAVKQGVPSARDVFRYLWSGLNDARGFTWESNPWCWCITFARVEQSGGAA